MGEWRKILSKESILILTCQIKFSKLVWFLNSIKRISDCFLYATLSITIDGGALVLV